MPLEVFYSYSHKDEDLRNELETHLALLARTGLIAPWHDRRIEPGTEWAKEIDEHVKSAHIILLLVSADFLASDYCYGMEMRLALERHAGPEHAIVIPIILRPVDWSGASFAHLQALPRDARPVTLWPNRDEAFAQIAAEIRKIVLRFQQTNAPTPSPPLTPPLLEDQITPKPRVLDAAMPSHIVKDRATELLALIRLPDSPGLAGVLQSDEEAEARPEDVRSKPFDVSFPIGLTGKPEPLKVSVELTSPDFAPPSQRKNLLVPVDKDSEVCSFLLTPLRLGSLLVQIELVWEDAGRGYRRLKTNCLAESESAASKPVMNVVQMPLETGASYLMNQKFSALGYSPSRARSLDTPAPAEARAKPGFLASPMLKAAALVFCVISVGAFFLVQRNVSDTASAPNTPIVGAAAPSELEFTTGSFNLAVEAARKNRSGTPRNAEIDAVIKDGQHNLDAARAAIARGDQAQASVFLKQVRLATGRLKAATAAPAYSPPPRN